MFESLLFSLAKIVVIYPILLGFLLLFAVVFALHCSIFKVPFAAYPLLVGTSGLEPPTSRLSGVRSNHLSYEPICLAAFFDSLYHFLAPQSLVEMRRIELLTLCVQGRCSPS